MATQRAMPNADAAWLHMDRPTNLMVITSVLWFDEPVDWERVKAVCLERLVKPYPRFSQRVSEARLPLQTPRFEDYAGFDFDRHFHHLALPAPGDRAALQELVADLMATPLDHAKPLWDMYLVDGYGDGSAIVTRMHHCIADGIALARVLLGLTDDEPEPPAAPRGDGRHVRPGPARRLAGPAVSLAKLASRATGALAREGVALVTDPGTILRGTRDDAKSLAKILTARDDQRTVLKGELGVAQRAVWTEPFELAEVKRIGHATGTTVNDVLVTAIAGALRTYFGARGTFADEIRAFVPFNLRSLTRPVPRELGNKFGLVFVPLPVGVGDLRERLRAVNREMTAVKRSADGRVAYGVLTAIGLTPLDIERIVVDVMSAKASLVLTNVPGPDRPVYLAGTPVKGVLVWAPRSGSVAMSATIFSYNGEVTIGLAVDAGLVPDPETILSALRDELAALRRVSHRRRSSRPRRRSRAAASA